MSKKRKSLDDSLAEEFVFGAADPPSIPEPAIEPGEEDNEPAQAITSAPAPKQSKQRRPTSKPKTTMQTRNSIVNQLLESAEQKEATIRLTVDLTESMHRKLSLLSARSGKKKAVIVRMLLEDVLQDVSE